MIARVLMGVFSGLLFGLGLVISGMTDPAKVLNFLDLFGTWDPSLACVLGGASVTAWIGFRLVRTREQPLLFEQFELPTRKDIDVRLIAGSALFGVGWGIGGFCPGPAWTALSLAAPGTLVFLPGMLIGMLLANRWLTRLPLRTYRVSGQ